MGPASEAIPTPRPISSYLLWSGFLLIALVSVAPLLFERLPIDWVPPYASPAAALASKAAVLLIMGLTIVIGAWAVRREESRCALVVVLLVIGAGLMVNVHYHRLDSVAHVAEWQRPHYLGVLNHTWKAPHSFRPLPYGFTRSLEWITGDWLFSCLAYRGFFCYWFLWATYRFARIWLRPTAAFATVVILLLFYPLSVWHYWGQLTDPLSHALFLLAFILLARDRWIALAVALALGIAAKETVVLMVPAYWACYWRGGLRPLLKATALGLACVAAFLVVRVPLGWRPGYEKLNGTQGLMVSLNLGIGQASDVPGPPQYQNYLQPALFVLPFVPFIARGWRRIDRRLRLMCLTLVPLLLASNLCFGWMYESRNYMPLVPLLAICALTAGARRTPGRAEMADP